MSKPGNARGRLLWLNLAVFEWVEISHKSRVLVFCALHGTFHSRRRTAIIAQAYVKIVLAVEAAMASSRPVKSLKFSRMLVKLRPFGYTGQTKSTLGVGKKVRNAAPQDLNSSFSAVRLGSVHSCLLDCVDVKQPGSCLPRHNFNGCSAAI
jgi:hypothetical protein